MREELRTLSVDKKASAAIKEGGWKNRIRLGTVGSTNEEAKILAKAGQPHGTLVLAEEQTSGRGRRGRSWHSPYHHNIYMSLILRPSILAESASMLTLVMALAVSRGIKEVCGLQPAIKWPNDILIREKKVCGILTEMQMKDREIDFVIIGVGINVNGVEFPGELSGIATSLQQETGEAVEKEALIGAVMTAFEDYYESFLQNKNLSGVKQEYNDSLVNRGREVRVMDSDGEWTAEALGINDTGELVVRRQDGRLENIFAGEVSVRGIYGYV